MHTLRSNALSTVGRIICFSPCHVNKSPEVWYNYIRYTWLRYRVQILTATHETRLHSAGRDVVFHPTWLLMSQMLLKRCEIYVCNHFTPS